MRVRGLPSAHKHLQIRQRKLIVGAALGSEDPMTLNDLKTQWAPLNRQCWYSRITLCCAQDVFILILRLYRFCMLRVARPILPLPHFASVPGSWNRWPNYASGRIGLMAHVKIDPDKVREFKDAECFYEWLGKHHDKECELWIKIHKLDSGSRRSPRRKPSTLCSAGAGSMRCARGSTMRVIFSAIRRAAGGAPGAKSMSTTSHG